MTAGGSLAVSGAAIALGAAVAWAGSDEGATAGGVPVFGLCIGLAFVVNWIAFVPSYLARTEHFYDLTGTFTYLTVIATAVAFASQRDARSVVLAVLVAVWALRLGTFLFGRVRRVGRDARFDDIKVDAARFLMSWTIQGLWVSLTAACALAALTADGGTPFGALGAIGVLVWASGFTIEVVADRQKGAFRRDPANGGRFITTGLWAWSRHPNYFGEITLWVGVAVVALPALSGWQHVTLISPVFVFLLITRVSGVPLLEARSSARWGDDPGYRTYVARTPVLIMRPPRSR